MPFAGGRKGPRLVEEDGMDGVERLHPSEGRWKVDTGARHQEHTRSKEMAQRPQVQLAGKMDESKDSL